MRALAMVLLMASAASADPVHRPSLDAGPLAPPRGTPGPWPLSELPSVQPHLDLAMAHDACTPEAQKRQKDDEVRAYLTAWCRIRAGEREAVDALAPIAKSKNLPLARIAQLDIVNLLADFEDRQHAVAHLERLGLANAHALDLLAATYLALGQHDDAFFVGNEAIRVDAHAMAADRCERELAWWSYDVIEARTSIFLEKDAANACERRLRALSCAIDAGRQLMGLGARLVAMRECYVALPDDPELVNKLAVIAVAGQWKLLGEAKDWLELERQLEPAFAVHGAELLAVTALEAAAADNCDRPQLDAIAAAVKRVRAADAHDAVFDRRLADLAKPDPGCRR